MADSIRWSHKKDTSHRGSGAARRKVDATRVLGDAARNTLHPRHFRTYRSSRHRARSRLARSIPSQGHSASAEPRRTFTTYAGTTAGHSSRRPSACAAGRRLTAARNRNHNDRESPLRRHILGPIVRIGNTHGRRIAETAPMHPTRQRLPVSPSDTRLADTHLIHQERELPGVLLPRVIPATLSAVTRNHLDL